VLLQQNISALSSVCIEGEKLRSLSFQVINDFASKNHKNEVLVSELMYCANTARLSCTQSSVYRYQC
jgi:thermostable 8-oxoguanine DNA glycosylase